MIQVINRKRNEEKNKFDILAFKLWCRSHYVTKEELSNNLYCTKLKSTYSFLFFRLNLSCILLFKVILSEIKKLIRHLKLG